LRLLADCGLASRTPAREVAVMKATPRFCLVLVLLASLLATGCTSVTSRKLVGDQPVTLDPKVWNGVWTNDEDHNGVILFRVKDATNGVLEVGMSELTETEMKLEKFDVHVRQAGAWWWANFKAENETNFAFVRVSKPGVHLLVWGPDPAAFVKRVKAGGLKGELLKDSEGKETGSVIIDELPPDQLRAIESGEWKDVLDLSSPGILRRLGPTPKE